MKGPLLKDLNLFPEKVSYNYHRYYYSNKVRDWYVIYRPFRIGYRDILINQKCFWDFVDQGKIEIL